VPRPQAVILTHVPSLNGWCHGRLNIL
jgi:hypothetical protein